MAKVKHPTNPLHRLCDAGSGEGADGRGEMSSDELTPEERFERTFEAWRRLKEESADLIYVGRLYDLPLFVGVGHTLEKQARAALVRRLLKAHNPPGYSPDDALIGGEK